MLAVFSLEQRHDRVFPLDIDGYHINITGNNQLIRTKIEQVFINNSNNDVGGFYIFPVPEGDSLSNFTLSFNGKPGTGELLSQEESRRTYQSIVREGNYTGFVEHFGTRAFLADVPRIPANGEVHIQFEYAQIVHIENDLAKYTYPLSLAKSETGRIADLTLEMEIESDSELRTIYSSSHEVTINRKNDNHANIRYEGKNVDPDDNFECYYSVSDDKFGMTLLTHRAKKDEDGYFMLLISPKYEMKKTEIFEKDFIFVLDRSGSMAGRKVEQAKAALRYCVQNLNEGDRFNLILFNTDITSLADRLNRQEELSAALPHKLIDVEDGREKALAFIENIEGRGGTNINEALLTALDEEPDPNRPRIIVFLTDGCPTVGVRNAARILENVKQANANQSRIFVFGVGSDLNVRLLDKMAADNGGSRNYVELDEDIEIAVSSLFRKMNEPVLVNVELDFGQIITKELSPAKIPDMFREEQFTLFGRYENHGDIVLKLWGHVDSEQQDFSKNVHFAKIETDNDFLPHLWAQRRIAELVDQAVLYSLSEELRKEIERLIKDYGVITEHIRFVYADDGSRRLVLEIDKAYDRSKPKDDVVKHSKRIERQKNTRHKIQYDNTKYVGHKAFYRHGGKWIDTKYDGNSDLKRVKFPSEDFDELMREIPELDSCIKVGLPMIICHDGVNYEIIPRGRRT